MAQQNIESADTLPEGRTKLNANFDELYGAVDYAADIEAFLQSPDTAAARTALGVGLALRSPSATALFGGTNPHDMTWVRESTSRAFAPLSAALTLGDDRFEIDTGRYTFTGDTAISGGQVAGDGTMLTPAVGFKAPFMAAILDVNDEGASSLDFAAVGFWHGIKRWYCGYERVTQTAYISYNDGGGATDTTAAFTMTGAHRIACVIYKGDVTLWTEQNGVWTFRLAANHQDKLDWTDPATLAAIQVYVLLDRGTGDISATRLRYGYSAPVGLSNHYIVTYEDGEPLRSPEGHFYFTATSAGIAAATGAAEPSSGSMSVLRALPGIWDFEEVGKIFTNRSGNICADSVSHLLFDRDAGYWRCLVSTWGDYVPVTGEAHVVHFTSRDNLLAGIHVLESGTQIDFDGSTVSEYDAMAVKIDGIWYIAHTRTSDLVNWGQFDPFLSWGTDILAPDNTTSYAPTDWCEGTRIAKVNGSYWVLAGNVDDMLVLAFPAMTLAGTLAIDIAANPPAHPGLFAAQENGKTVYYTVTFDTTQAVSGKAWTHGNTRVYRAVETATGWEFAP